MAMVANTARDKKTRPRPFMPADFNPFTQPRRPKASELPKAPITVLRDVFVKGGPKRGAQARRGT